MNKSVILAADDFNVGDNVCIYDVTGMEGFDPNCGGRALKITAIQLPYIIADVSNGGGPATIDTRFIRLMRVSDEYVKAQTVQIPANTLETTAAEIIRKLGR